MRMEIKDFYDYEAHNVYGPKMMTAVYHVDTERNRRHHRRDDLFYNTCGDLRRISLESLEDEEVVRKYSTENTVA